MPDIRTTAAGLVSAGTGVLAADESVTTMSKRLEAAGVPASAESRRRYRELLLTTPHLRSWVSGMILCDETLHQRLSDGTPFGEAGPALGVAVGIKVDTGTVPLPLTPGALVTEGLDGLSARLVAYRGLGATFAKWRAVLAPVGLHPRSVEVNAHALARYAAACQEAGLVPIVEPEVLMDGDHDIDVAATATTAALSATFAQLDRLGVDPSGMVLKPNMVVPGSACPRQAEPAEVAERTVEVLAATVAPTLAGIAFLSGGQSNETACANLGAINEVARRRSAPWPLTFSFGRALVNDALSTWAGRPGNESRAQDALARNCAAASAAATAGTPRVGTDV